MKASNQSIIGIMGVSKNSEEEHMTHKLPKLPYEFNELEPHIDARTM